MRGIDTNIDSVSRTVTAGSVPQSAIQIPAIGSLLGLNLRLTETADDSGGTIVATRITAAIERFQVRDRNGSVVMSVTGLQLERIANSLSQVGDDVDAPAPGDGTGVEYLRHIPLTIAQEDMPAFIDITWAPESAMYSVSPTGDTTVTLALRGKFTPDPVQTLRIKAVTPNHAVGQNSIGNLLPDGELVERLLILPNDGGPNPMVDADITDVRLSQNGFNLLDGATIVDVFEPEDTEFRRDGHNTGTILARVPVFKVNNTTLLVLNLGVDADFDLVTVSRRPQPQK